MPVLKFSLVLMMFLVLASQFFVFPTFAEVGESEAASALTRAEEAVFSGYLGVLKAEGAGANVSGLLVQLNEAGRLLAKAKLAYHEGDFESARAFAVHSQDRLTGFVEEAEGLKGIALQQHFWDFMVNVVGSIVGTVAVVGGSFFVWFLLKRKFGKAGNVG